MNDFYAELLKYEEKFKEIQSKESALQQESQILQVAFQGFLKEAGLPDQFTMAQVMTLAVRKSRD